MTLSFQRYRLRHFRLITSFSTHRLYIYIYIYLLVTADIDSTYVKILLLPLLFYLVSTLAAIFLTKMFLYIAFVSCKMLHYTAYFIIIFSSDIKFEEYFYVNFI